MERKTKSIDRRGFIKTSAAAVAGSAILSSIGAGANMDEPLDRRNERPNRMAYRKLGRTNFAGSRLVFGCGAALAGGKAVILLERAFEAGINHYDVGSNAYYKGSENALAPFFKAHRGEIWVTSKGPVRLLERPRAGAPLTSKAAKGAAKQWTKLLNASLKDLKTDYVDAYYMMMADEPSLVKSVEMRSAFDKARDAGKVGHFGISTHLRAEACLEAAIEAGCYSLVTIAITPAGWYDSRTRGPVWEAPNLKRLRPLLDRAREAGIGLVGMKAGRYLAPLTAGGKNDHRAYDRHYGKTLMSAGLSSFQRSYAFVLEHGLDAVNADMQNFKHFEENVVAARDSHMYFA